jgi:diketogulonate reductase-like aldo/keto reductase
MNETMPFVTLPGGDTMPAYGHGTWHMGENRRHAGEEEASLRLGIELGVALIDTAEMYGNGVAEEIAARAIGDNRDGLFIVSKVLPYNASRNGTIAACEQSLRRLKTDRIDLYLLHWRGSHPFEETLAAFDKLQRDGKIRHHGVSNFGLDDMKEWVALSGGKTVASNQILYNLTRRGPEYDLIPWCRERGIPIMAYSPIEQGRMLNHKGLVEVAQRRGATPAQVALAWLLRQEGMIVIPKARQEGHLHENLGALNLTLTDTDLAALDRAFPPPTRRAPLGML